MVYERSALTIFWYQEALVCDEVYSIVVRQVETMDNEQLATLGSPIEQKRLSRVLCWM